MEEISIEELMEKANGFQEQCKIILSFSNFFIGVTGGIVVAYIIGCTLDNLINQNL